MKSLLILFLLSAGLATSASAQAGWGSSNSWDAPKKKTVTKTTSAARKSQAVSQDKAMNNGAAAPEASAPVPAAAVPAASGLGGGAVSSNAPMGMGMSAAPGTPVMMQSGRNVLRDDAIAARERRMLHRAGKPAPVAQAPAEVPVSAPAAVSSAGATGASNAANGQVAAPAAAKPAAPKPARSAPAPKKKAPAAPAGW